VKTLTLICFLFLGLAFQGMAEEWVATTLNTYWYMDARPGQVGDPPRSIEEKNEKTQNLTRLLVEAARAHPIGIVGLQEIGSKEDGDALASALSKATNQEFVSLFAKGRDTYTGQNVGALLNLSSGWKVVGQPGRSSELEKAISKHLTFTIEKNHVRLHVVEVHLRVPRNKEAKAARQNQIRAILQYAHRFLKEENSNLIIMGDFNEPARPGSDDSDLNILTENGMEDAADALTGLMYTHAKTKRTLDRMIISPALRQGLNHLKVGAIWITPHELPPRPTTDHFPLSMLVRED